LPVKAKKLIKSERHFHYFVIFDAKYIYIQQRTEKDIWKGLFEFPMEEGSQTTVDSPPLLSNFFIKKYGRPSTVDRRLTYRQTLSHQYINGNFYEIRMKKLPEPDASILRIPKTSILTYAFPKIVRTYLEDRLNFLS
jgi:A/G-specific adenine glycosylase